MEKKSCCCAGEAETVNVNMETTGVTGAEATANTVTAETETPSDDAVCHCRHKHRTEKEEKDLLTRLNRIEGQVRGIKAMVQDERYCPDILVQVSAVQSALNGFCKVLLSNHIKTCVVEDIKNGNEETDCSGTLRDDQEDDVEMGGNNEIEIYKVLPGNVLIITAVVLYIKHLLYPYDFREKFPYDDPPPKFFGSFSLGELVQYIIQILTLPIIGFAMIPLQFLGKVVDVILIIY